MFKLLLCYIFIAIAQGWQTFSGKVPVILFNQGFKNCSCAKKKINKYE